MAATPNPLRRPYDVSTFSVVIRTAILILSGYLLGTTAARVCPPVAEACALAGGATGIIAYIVVAIFSRQKRALDAKRALHTATARLERRVEQHVRHVTIDLLSRLHTAAPRHHEQYLTVVRSARTVR